MKLPEYPLPDNMKWVAGDHWIGARGTEEKLWWYGWVHIEENGRSHLEVTIHLQNKRAEKIGTFDTPDAACKFISAYLILGDSDE